MGRLRRHLLTIAVTTLAIHMAAVASGALRVCWGSQHTHAGAASEDCPMHHQPRAQTTHQDQHAHGNTAAPADDAGQQLTCGCSSDPSLPYVAPVGILAPTIALSYSTRPVLISMDPAESPDDARLPPLAPPPRSTSSARS